MPLTKRRVLITAGPTREFADPVRFLSNPSSGRMGIRLADVLARRGSRVHLVLGPTELKPKSRRVRVHPVVSAREMNRVVQTLWKQSDVVVATAAVSDWRFARTEKSKEKKGTSRVRWVRLIRNPDIIAGVGAKKKSARKPLLIGFSLETDRLRDHAHAKLAKKNLDLIIANAPTSFSSPFIQGLWIERMGRVQFFSRMTKDALATKLADWIEKKLKATHGAL